MSNLGKVFGKVRKFLAKQEVEETKKRDLTGMRFGRLIVIEEAPQIKPGKTRWLCRCDCGEEKIINGRELMAGDTQSCGCLKRELVAKRMSHLLRTHGESRTKLYRKWYSMIGRCSNPKDVNYKNYGFRGINVCQEWESDFLSFKDWALSHGYLDGLEIDRIDVNKDYCPENCRWVTHTENENNKRDNRIETYNGATDTLANLCRRFKANYANVCSRLYQGFTIEEAFEKPYRKTRIVNLTVNGETATVKEWADRHKINSSVVCERINAGWPVEKALNTPLRKRKDNKPWQQEQ